MTLSCSCDWDGPEPGQWYWDGYSKQQPMPERTRRTRCCSCSGLINTGDIAVEFYRHKCIEVDSIEHQIHGDSKPLASWYECEECNDLRAALEDLGYCVNLGDYMRDLIDEYNDMRKELRELEKEEA